MNKPDTQRELMRALKNGTDLRTLADTACDLANELTRKANELLPTPRGAVDLRLTEHISVVVKRLSREVADELKRDGNGFFVAGKLPTEKDLGQLIWRLSLLFTRTASPSPLGQVAAARASCYELAERVWRSPNKRASALRTVAEFVAASKGEI